MLYATVETETINGTIIGWHVGETKPREQAERICKSIQASGDELDYIRRGFDNIPMSHKRVVIWKGEIAQFIYDNL